MMNPGNNSMIQPKTSILRLYSKRRKCNFQRHQTQTLQGLTEMKDSPTEVHQQQTKNQKVN